jgi:hypothetical protein
VGSDQNIDELEEVVDSVMFEMVLRLTRRIDESKTVNE